MKQPSKIISFFLLLLLLLNSSCKKASTEIIERTGIKAIATTFFEKATINFASELAELGLSKEAAELIIKNFDDDLIKQFLKIASEDKNFLNTIKRNPNFLKTYKIFAQTNFSANPKQLSWLTRNLTNENYTFKNVGKSVEIFDNKTGNLLGTFENNKLIAIAGQGGKQLNPLLNIHPLIPNTHYKIGSTSTYSDAFGRVEKMTCPLMSNETRIPRSPIEQGLSKKLKNGKIVVDESGNAIKVKAGYYKYSDDGGHLLANRHGGVSEQINVLPMTSEANKVYFREIENEITKAISQGKIVKDFTVSPKFTGKSGRPDKFKISYYIDGQYHTKTVMN